MVSSSGSGFVAGSVGLLVFTLLFVILPFVYCLGTSLRCAAAPAAFPLISWRGRSFFLFQSGCCRLLPVALFFTNTGGSWSANSFFYFKTCSMIYRMRSDFLFSYSRSPVLMVCWIFFCGPALRFRGIPNLTGSTGRISSMSCFSVNYSFLP